ncbi:hypothetical protein FKX85_00875 [Echinicola soli]|uniref:C1q domain-containing protein n=1 Tax=Echinicola soli TaxID=2591634 RepID=A0A514CDE4_9BACT|nr:hypothetical protein [Echinicola soli]QDH77674.1 hypothetical protein FKX85_00875 [Echinicola soli]
MCEIPFIETLDNDQDMNFKVVKFKTAILGLFFFVAVTETLAQTGIGTQSPDENAVLDVSSTTKGVLIPRLTGEQVTALEGNSPADGMLVYNTDQSCVQIYRGSAFECLTVDTGADLTKDVWVDDNSNTQIKLGAKSDGTTARPAGTEFVAKDNGRVGIGTSNPDWQLHVQGDRAIGLFKRVNNTAANNAPGFLFTRARGTLGSELGISSGDFLGKVQFRGRVGSADEDYATLGYVATSTTIGDGRFAFFNGTGSSESVEVVSINTNSTNILGVGTATPQKTIHVNGSLQVTNELNVGGNATTAGSAGTAGQYLTSNGSGAAPTWQSPAGIVPTSNGTVIAVNGELRIAQEIIAHLSDNFSTSSSSATAIGNLNVEIMDNEGTYSGTASTNSFTVTADGIYQIVMNMQLSNTASGNPVIGIWDNTAGAWVARVNDAIGTGLQTFTLITSINMLAAKTYSFRCAASGGTTTIRAQSSGDTGSGPVSQVSVKRLR